MHSRVELKCRRPIGLSEVTAEQTLMVVFARYFALALEWASRGAISSAISKT